MRLYYYDILRYKKYFERIVGDKMLIEIKVAPSDLGNGKLLDQGIRNLLVGLKLETTDEVGSFFRFCDQNLGDENCLDKYYFIKREVLVGALKKSGYRAEAIEVSYIMTNDNLTTFHFSKSLCEVISN